MKTLIFCVIVATCAGNALALHAEERSRSRLATSIFSGIQLGDGDISFTYSDGEQDINSSFSYGFGISYDGIALSHELTLILSSEINFIRAETDPINEQSGDSPAAQYRYTGIPILLWGELHQPGVVGPFVKLGVGAVHSTIEEDYRGSTDLDFSADYWSFACGTGAGVRYCPTDQLDVLLVAEGFIGSGSGVATNPLGQNAETDSPFGFEQIGVRLRYWF